MELEHEIIKKFSHKVRLSKISNKIGISDIELIESTKKSTKNSILTKSGYDIIPYTSDFYSTMKSIGMGETMKNSELRKVLVEHPLVGIIAITLITIGFSKHKKKTTDAAKFKTIAVFYSIALLLILSRIPWSNWFSN